MKNWLFRSGNEVMNKTKGSIFEIWDVLQILQSSRSPNLQRQKPCWTLKPPCGDTDSWEATGWTCQDQAEFAVIITYSPYSYIHIYIYTYVIYIYIIYIFIYICISYKFIYHHTIIIVIIPDICWSMIYDAFWSQDMVPRRRWEAFNCRVGEANEANAGREGIGSWRAGRWARGGAWDDNMDHIWIIYG